MTALWIIHDAQILGTSSWVCRFNYNGNRFTTRFVNLGCQIVCKTVQIPLQLCTVYNFSPKPHFQPRFTDIEEACFEKVAIPDRG